jgi:phage-related protein
MVLYSKNAIVRMQSEWEVVIINELAEQEILKFSADLQAKFLRITELLMKLGPSNVSMPHVKPLEDKLWEMRLNGKDNIARSIYFLSKNKKIVILHSFIKKTQTTPRKALEIAKQRFKEAKDDKI